MTKQQPDKLFHDKLASYARPAPTRAWDAIEASMDKRSRKGLWLKVAASLLLIGTATYIVWHISGPRGAEHGGGVAIKHPAVQHAAPVVRDSAGRGDTSAPVVDSAVMEHTPEAIQAPLAAARHKNMPARRATEKATAGIAASGVTKHRALPPPGAAVGSAPNETPLVHSPLPAAAETPVTNSYAEAGAAHTIATDTHTASAAAVANTTTSPQGNKNITLVYTVREASEYLDKKSLAEATSDEPKPSTLKKLLKKAADLKSNQDPLGELRQRKNEILALNFRSEKQRESKK